MFNALNKNVSSCSVYNNTVVLRCKWKCACAKSQQGQSIFFSLRKYILESKCKARAWAGNLLFVKKNDTGFLIEHTSSYS